MTFMGTFFELYPHYVLYLNTQKSILNMKTMGEPSIASNSERTPFFRGTFPTSRTNLFHSKNNLMNETFIDSSLFVRVAIFN